MKNRQIHPMDHEEGISEASGDPDMDSDSTTTRLTSDQQNFQLCSWTDSDVPLLRSSHSLPNVQVGVVDIDLANVHRTPRERCSTNVANSKPIRIPSSTRHTVDTDKQSHAQRPQQVEIVRCDDIVIHLESPTTSAPTFDCSTALRTRLGSAPPDFLTEFIPSKGEKIPRNTRHRYLDTELEHHPLLGSTVPASSSLQRPYKGQSLISFLQSFPPSDNELERENAHFIVCESVLCVLEQRKWKISLQKLDMSDGAVGRYSDEGEGEGVPFEFGLGESNVPLRSRGPITAEEIGMSLLGRFTDLPEAADIPWQTLDRGFLGNSCCSLSTGDCWTKISFCRGTNDWAPPRPQIIFTKRVARNSRRKVLQAQKYRCRGCGLKVSLEYSRTFRLCAYTGHYYCTVCHRNQVSMIPGHVFDDWDFKLYPVSVVAYRMLSDIWFSPLFHVKTIRPSLYDRISRLNAARFLRWKLKGAMEHLALCRFYEQQRSGDIFQELPEYLTNDIDLWSLADLRAVERGEFKQDVRLLIAKCDAHIENCELCRARGFLCDICHASDVLFPWHDKVMRCAECGTCSHVECRIRNAEVECQKCSRMKLRR